MPIIHGLLSLEDSLRVFLILNRSQLKIYFNIFAVEKFAYKLEMISFNIELTMKVRIYRRLTVIEIILLNSDP